MFGRKKEKLFGNNIDVDCQYCANSSDFEGVNVCKLGRYIKSDGTCKKFVYDPLKRTPSNLPPLKPHNSDEFKL